MAPIQNSRISEVKISFKASGALKKRVAAVNMERKLISTRSDLMNRMSKNAMKVIKRKTIDPLYCNSCPASGLRCCSENDVPFSFFKLVWLSVNVGQASEFKDNL